MTVTVQSMTYTSGPIFCTVTMRGIKYTDAKRDKTEYEGKAMWYLATAIENHYNVISNKKDKMKDMLDNAIAVYGSNVQKTDLSCTIALPVYEYKDSEDEDKTIKELRFITMIQKKKGKCTLDNIWDSPNGKQFEDDMKPSPDVSIKYIFTGIPVLIYNGIKCRPDTVATKGKESMYYDDRGELSDEEDRSLPIVESLISYYSDKNKFINTIDSDNPSMDDAKHKFLLKYEPIFKKYYKTNYNILIREAVSLRLSDEYDCDPCYSPVYQTNKIDEESAITEMKVIVINGKSVVNSIYPTVVLKGVMKEDNKSYEGKDERGRLSFGFKIEDFWAVTSFSSKSIGYTRKTNSAKNYVDF
ncbi:hypothetical protein BDK51DRAFT_43406 [Blyttiomyces helicus]|uniref:Uncharacterized protein n=1 Tax=Blyttiomyces helicus TaxID=388810 RepID=A0A4P9WH38_9FUNG|nr:hypothetical protein BDK51DRAFT_43406 [Blyttiomyces helicus]|eukprot:RKO90370.1 hypothetical protein BDK51DRAFT_43406 [Blyttiomyces helicus]